MVHKDAGCIGIGVCMRRRRVTLQFAASLHLKRVPLQEINQSGWFQIATNKQQHERLLECYVFASG